MLMMMHVDGDDTPIEKDRGLLCAARFGHRTRLLVRIMPVLNIHGGVRQSVRVSVCQ